MKKFGKVLQWMGAPVTIGCMMYTAIFTHAQGEILAMQTIIGAAAGHVVVFLGNIIVALAEHGEANPEPRYFGS